MAIRHVYSEKTNPKEAILELKEQLLGFQEELVMFFASSSYEQEILGKEMKKAFSKAVVFGSTSYSELVSGKMMKNSLVAVAFDKESIGDFKIELVQNVKVNYEKGIKNAFKSFEKHFGESSYDMDLEKYVGIVLMDFSSTSEEKVIEKIGDLTNVMFVGGSSADNWQFAHTAVFYEGNVYHDATVLALLKPNKRFGFIKTQSFVATDKKLVATKVELEKREVLEYNNKPAGLAYAEVIGVDVSEADKHFSSNPVGVVSDRDIFVRSPILIEEGRMGYVCNILEGQEVRLLKATDIISDTKKAIEDKLEEFGKISSLINFNCTLRTVELEQRGIVEEFGKVFENVPTAGFSTYGEAYIGHMNQTAVILVFE